MLDDPSPIWQPVPDIGWRSRPEPPVPAGSREIGLAVGLAVGGLFALIAAATTFPDGAFGPPSWSLAPAILAAGGVGGWVSGPLAWRARSVGGWLGAAILLAFLAVVIGDVVVVSQAILFSSSLSLDPSVPAPIGLTGGIVGLFLLGLVFFGWFALLVTLVAAALWAGVIAVLRTWHLP